jgi:hypothetical protein
LFLWIQPLLADEIYFEGTLSSSATISISGDPSLTTQVYSARLKFNYEYSQWSININRRLEYNAIYDWRSAYSEQAEDEYRTRLWVDDAYVNWHGDTVDIAIGYQKIVWGQADDLRVVDIINLLDLKNFVLFDIDEYRISLPMARLETSLLGWEWQGMVILSTEPNQLSPEGSEFPLLPKGIQQKESANNAEFSLRGQRFFGGADIAIYAFRSYYDNPVFIFSTEGARLDHQRETMWGASASRPVGNWFARGEIAQFIGRRFNRNDSDLVTSDVLQWLVGIDYLYQNWLLSAQATDQHIDQWQSYYTDNKEEPLYTLAADGRLLSDTVNIRFAITHADYDGGGQLYQTKLSYRPQYHWEWRVHLGILSGDSRNIFGQFRNT